MGWRAVLRRSAAAGIASFLLWSCRGVVDYISVDYACPFFHHLEVFDDRFTVVSPDSKTLRGLTFDGRELWRRSIVGDPLVGRYDGTHLYVQEKNAVIQLHVADGTTEKLFDVPEYRQYVKDETKRLVYLIDQRFDRNTFQLLDPDSRRPMWERQDIEKVLHVEKDLLVAATATRDYDATRRSYATSGVAVTGLDRRTGEVRWRIPMSSRNAFVHAAAVPACLVTIDEGAGGGLLCIDPTSGRILGKRVDSAPWGLSYADVVADGDHVAFLEDTTSSEKLLRFVAVPSFEVAESLRLDSNERTLSLHSNYIFMKGLYSAGCFDRHTGEQRWQRTLVGEWKLLGNQILLSDYESRRRRARLVMVDVPSGSERIIVSEAASLRPR